MGKLVWFAIALAVLAIVPAAAAPMGTAFTYQGKLTDSAGAPLTGSYDLTFKLFDTETDGNQVGSDVTLTAVPVSGGLFTVKLDFGSSAFTTGNAVWLETAVAGTTVSPRVQITPSPVALWSAAPWGTSTAGISYTGNVGIGTTTPAYPLSFADVTGDKISLHGTAASHYGFGIQSHLLQIYSDGLGADIAFGYGRSDNFTETVRIRGGGNVGIGTSSPATKLDVAGTAKMTGFQLGSLATAGQVLTTNASGVGTWQALPAPPTSLPPSGAAGGDLTGTYPNPAIATGAVTSAKIADGTVALADMAANSVDSTRVVDASIALADLAADSVNGAKVVDGSIALADMAAGSVDSTKIVDASVALADMAANSVNSAKLVDGTVALADMAANSVDSTKIVDASVAAADLASDAASLAKVSGGAASVSSGNVGIGTTSPAAKLDVAGTAKVTGFQLGSSATAGQVLTANASGVGTWMAPASVSPSGPASGDLTGSYPGPTIAANAVAGAEITDGAVAAVDLASDAASLNKVSAGAMSAVSGNIGIGTGVPGFPLSFSNTLGDKISLWGNTGAHYGLGVQGSLLQIHTAGASDSVAFGYGESASFTETMRVKGNGNVGIGISSPTARLQINGGGSAEALAVYHPTLMPDQFNIVASTYVHGAGYGWQSFTAMNPPGCTGNLAAVEIYFGADDGTSAWQGTLSIYEGEGYGGTRLSTQTVSGDGPVRPRLFALPTPVALTAGSKYTIYVDTYTSIRWLEDTGNPYGGGRNMVSPDNDFWFRTYQTTILEDQPSLVVQPGNGFVGFGTAYPSYRIQLPNQSTESGRAQANRWDTYSSARWKTNITPIADALEKVTKLQGVYYDWKPEQGGKHDIGFVAEEVGKVVPELVSWEADGKNASGMDYARVNALLVEAIKQQQKQIEDQQRQIDGLRKLISDRPKGK